MPPSELLGINDLVQLLPKGNLYAFPPVCLLLAVLWRVLKEEVHLFFCPSHVWFSDLVSLLEKPSCRISVIYQPLESASNYLLTLKKFLLLALIFLKRIRGSQALLLIPICLHFAPSLVKVLLRPRCGYLPNVVSLFHSQTVLQSLLLPLICRRKRGCIELQF